MGDVLTLLSFMTLAARIEDHILSKLIAKEKRCLGVEVEHFVYDRDLKRIDVNSTGRALMEDMKALQTDDERPDAYSLEPGGQLEWSSVPFRDLHCMKRAYDLHMKRFEQVLGQWGLVSLDLSLEPFVGPEEVELVDQLKYQLMDRRFRETGAMGAWMMRNTTSIQLNVGYTSRDNAEKMAFLADCFEPICALLFANTPFMHGEAVGRRNMRQVIWHNTDGPRSGSLLDHGIEGTEGLLAKYAEYALTVPVIARVSGDGSAVEAFDGTIGDWLGELDRAGRLTPADIQQALRQIFTHVRFKDVLEVRGADRTPKGAEMAPPAFWVGLLMGDRARDRALELVECLSVEDRRALQRASCRLELEAEGPCGKTMRAWMEEVCDIALDGLDRRAELYGIQSERAFLEGYVQKFFEKGPVSLRRQAEFEQSGMDLLSFLASSSQKEHL
jgi:glutamate--cysteine ligase